MKKAFTLVELLAIILIIGLLAIVTARTIDKNLKNSRQTLYDAQITEIKEAVLIWGVDNVDRMPVDDKALTLTLEDLDGYVDDYLENPLTGKEISKTSTVTITKNEENYDIEINIIDK